MPATQEQVEQFNRIRKQIERDSRRYVRNEKPAHHNMHKSPDDIKRLYPEPLKNAGKQIAKAYMVLSKAIFYIEEAYDVCKSGGLVLDGRYRSYMNAIDHNFKMFCSDTRSLMTDKEKDTFCEEYQTVGDAIDDVLAGRLYWRPASEHPHSSCNVLVRLSNGLVTDAFYNHLTDTFSRLCTHWMIPPSEPNF